MKRAHKHILIAFSALAGVVFATQAMALPTTWHFTSGGTYSGSGYGNSLSFTGSDGSTAKATGWGDSGTGGAFEPGQVKYWSGGLGTCNQGEGVNCSGPIHQVDNVVQRDWVLFTLDGTYELDYVRIDPWGTWDRDVTYWIGNIAPGLDLTGISYSDLAALGFGPQKNVFNSRSSSGINIDLEDQIGNALLIGAYKDGTTDNRSHQDRFKIKKLKGEKTHSVPEPATMALFGTGLAGAFLRRKRA